MNNDLISREALKEQFTDGAYTVKGVREIIDNAPIVDTTEQEENAYNEGYAHGLETKRPQGELAEIKHRLNLLIGVLYSNQVISQSDFDYMEDSIKKLMKGGAE